MRRVLLLLLVVVFLGAGFCTSASADEETGASPKAKSSQAGKNKAKAAKKAKVKGKKGSDKAGKKARKQTPKVACMRGSEHPTCSPTQAPNEYPASARGSVGYPVSSQRIAAATSSFSPIPCSNWPVLWPTPRKLNRSATKPLSAAALAAR